MRRRFFIQKIIVPVTIITFLQSIILVAVFLAALRLYGIRLSISLDGNRSIHIGAIVVYAVLFVSRPDRRMRQMIIISLPGGDDSPLGINSFQKFLTG